LSKAKKWNDVFLVGLISDLRKLDGNAEIGNTYGDCHGCNYGEINTEGCNRRMDSAKNRAEGMCVGCRVDIKVGCKVLSMFSTFQFSIQRRKAVFYWSYIEFIYCFSGPGE
jgi:hypothetical protein